MALPLILAGPILRRVDAEVCSAWVALSRAASVEMKVWAGSQDSTGPGTVSSGDASLGSGQVNTRRIGANLHLAVVTINLKGPPAIALAPGTFHSYDIVIDGANSLKTEKLLEDEQSGARLPNVDNAAPLHLALGYHPNRLPGFVTPAATIEALRLAHGSCRRANFHGYDAMGWLDDFIKANLTTPDERPQQLYLTGDQIYADDVGTAMLHMLTGLGAELLGGDEQFPINENDADLTILNRDNFQVQRRSLLVRQQARMSTTESKNHLLGFGEFAAMYLASWSSRVWRPLATDAEMFRDRAVATAKIRPLLTDWGLMHDNSDVKWKTAKLKDEQGQRDNVKLFADVVPKAARALANCISYMIWDDHEVTDDWNISGRWQARVYSRKTGRAIMRNGMVAYGLFQGWGNDPQLFAKDGNNKDFLSQAEALYAGAGPYPIAGAIARMEEVLGFPGTADDKRASWHYRVDGPRHRTVVLDSRTRRGLGGPTSIKPPKLLGSTLDSQIPNGPLTDGRELLIVVAPAPVLGPTLFDKTFQPLASALKDVSNDVVTPIWRKIKHSSEQEVLAVQLEDQLDLTEGSESFDAEGWAGDEKQFEDLLKKLAGYPRSVLLSGDVHFSCTLSLDYWKGNNPVPSRIVQLTSSGARNGWELPLESQFRKNTVFQDLLGGVLVERIAWNGAAAITVPNGAHISPGRRARMKRSPALLPVVGWPTNTTVTTQPDWRWRVNLVRDLRTGGVNGAPPDPPPLGADINPGASFVGYVAATKRHAIATMTQPRLLRTLMFLSNIGLVGFRDSSGTLRLTHRLLSAVAPDSQTSAVNTLHDVSLAASTEAQPVLLTN